MPRYPEACASAPSWSAIRRSGQAGLRLGAKPSHALKPSDFRNSAIDVSDCPFIRRKSNKRANSLRRRLGLSGDFRNLALRSRSAFDILTIDCIQFGLAVLAASVSSFCSLDLAFQPRQFPSWRGYFIEGLDVLISAKMNEESTNPTRSADQNSFVTLMPTPTCEDCCGLETLRRRLCRDDLEKFRRDHEPPPWIFYREAYGAAERTKELLSVITAAQHELFCLGIPIEIRMLNKFASVKADAANAEVKPLQVVRHRHRPG